MKRVVDIGGPNGAGKTTAAAELLHSFAIREFVNADEIADGGRGLIASREIGRPLVIHDEARWKMIEEAIQ